MVAKAVRAVGTPATLARFKAATWQGTGKFFGRGAEIAYSGSWAIQPPEQARIVTAGTFNGQKFQRTLVINGDKGWIQMDDTTQEMDKARLAEEKERLYAAWVATVAPLEDKDFQFLLLGPARVRSHDTMGVTVTRSGHRGVDLYFDQTSGLLVKSTVRIKNLRTSVETTQEIFYSAYKNFNGVKRATRIIIEVDHKRFAEGTITKFKPQIKLADRVFYRPE